MPTHRFEPRTLRSWSGPTSARSGLWLDKSIASKARSSVGFTTSEPLDLEGASVELVERRSGLSSVDAGFWSVRACTKDAPNENGVRPLKNKNSAKVSNSVGLMTSMTYDQSCGHVPSRLAESCLSLSPFSGRRMKCKKLWARESCAKASKSLQSSAARIRARPAEAQLTGLGDKSPLKGAPLYNIELDVTTPGA